MAIQTRGFQVGVMPQYTPVNPSLVAFNPSAAVQGATQSINMARLIEEVKAKRALEQELAATRDKRIGAQNVGADVAIASGQKTLRQMPEVEEVESLDLANKKSTLPKKGELELAILSESIKTTPLEHEAARQVAQTNADKARLTRPALPDIVGAEVAGAKAKTAESNIATATAQTKQKAVQAQMELAQQQAQLASVKAPIETQLELLKIGQALGNAATEAEIATQMKQAELLLKKSMTEENLAQAEYARGLGRQSGRSETPIERAKKLQGLIKELDTMKVGDGTRTLGVYINETFDDQGNVKNSGIPLINRGPVTRDPIGDFYKQQREMYQQELLQLQGAIGGGQQPSQLPAQQTTPQTGGLPKVSNKAEYDKLPAGTEFTGPDGKRYIKK